MKSRSGDVKMKDDDLGEKAEAAFKAATTAPKWEFRNPFDRSQDKPGKGRRAPLPDQGGKRGRYFGEGGDVIEEDKAPKKVTYDTSKEPEELKASEIRAELKERQIGFAECFDKESLVEKLKWARSADKYM